MGHSAIVDPKLVNVRRLILYGIPFHSHAAVLDLLSAFPSLTAVWIRQCSFASVGGMIITHNLPTLRVKYLSVDISCISRLTADTYGHTCVERLDIFCTDGNTGPAKSKLWINRARLEVLIATTSRGPGSKRWAPVF